MGPAKLLNVQHQFFLTLQYAYATNLDLIRELTCGSWPIRTCADGRRSVVSITSAFTEISLERVINVIQLLTVTQVQ